MGRSSACRTSGDAGTSCSRIARSWRIDELEIMLTSIDKDKAKTNPSSVFDKPEDVVTHTELQPAEKAANPSGVGTRSPPDGRCHRRRHDQQRPGRLEQGCREEPAAGGQEGPTRPRRQADPGRGSADALHAVSPHRGLRAAATHPPVRTLRFSCQTTRHEAAPRSHRRRRRRRRHLPDQAAGRPRHRGHRARGRRRSRRHLVLEPLSRRALRFGELHLRLLLLARAARRMALEGALLRPAREPALPQPRRRQVRPAPAHAVQLPGRRGALRRGREPVAPRRLATGASSPAAS